MNREQWSTERMKGLGGSDAAAALGLSKYKTPFALYQEKRGEIPPVEETQPMRMGRMLEPVVLQLYADETQREVQRFEYHIERHKRLPFLYFSPDGRAGKRNVQAKTARTREGWGEPGTDQVPDDYLIQVQHEMACGELEVTDIPVLFGGQDFAIYEVPADRELQEKIADAEADLWDRIERGEPPAPVNNDDVQRRYGRKAIPNSLQANTVIAEACARLSALRADGERVKADCERLEVLIKSYLGHNETLVQGQAVLCTWKQQKGRTTFDADGLREMHPDLHAQFLKEGEPFRRFLLK